MDALIESLENGCSVIVPVYNSANSIEELCHRIRQTFKLTETEYEIILIDDRSHDNSWTILQNLSEKFPEVKPVRLMRNYGQHNALLCGIRKAAFNLICTIDDDLQNPPEEIPAMIKKLAEGYDVVYGHPENLQHGFLRNMASWMTKFALRGSMGINSASHCSAFRVFRTEIRNAFSDFSCPYPSIDVLLTWGTTDFTWISVKHNPRQCGQSNYTLSSLFRHALNMMTGFSIVPLQMATYLGLSLSLFGLFILAYVLTNFILYGNPVQGFPFLASTISIFSGAQLLVLGIMGEYLARIHFRTMKKPSYVERTDK
ncbi:MAG: glycosyltransferase [Candidatus Wallbacteria bacterium HGW-Wallbacteria-1]|jgi:undecaprenyl-phosphate 4-deoxy-4-formamido-L-arabinose transferase|uniref:Glycosyltransferase n=1 Tax=Candidatus Wallbacteria bacterium HGW-Wallbacteria-1 TaxID=2013854 RepID=A0A2N1PM61_9BACT|nr:MAG: glycosyltransferase [Candidatus Wallbacteria bacterium HGW-Wallbacteria-1]